MPWPNHHGHSRRCRDSGHAAALGASFALSPIDPVGFVDECARHGVLAVPSALTSNEMWALHRRGVRLVKLFHAAQTSPSTLRSMLDVTPLGEALNVMPSGGVSPDNAAEWKAAGAAVVAMGSNLVGKEISAVEGSPKHREAAAAWAASGRATAQRTFALAAQWRDAA